MSVGIVDGLHRIQDKKESAGQRNILQDILQTSMVMSMEQTTWKKKFINVDLSVRTSNI